MIASIILAVSISSSCITNFMTVPPWMPTSVSSADTFGSADHATASHRVTSNTLAAVEALFDAYYERVYFKSAAGVQDRDWSASQYGPQSFASMSFTNGWQGGCLANMPLNYRNGNRTVPDTRRLVEWPWLLRFGDNVGYALKDLVQSYGQMLRRNNWPKTTPEDSYFVKSCWSSSKLGAERLPVAYGWTPMSPGSQTFLNRCIPIFACDEDSHLQTDSLKRLDLSCYPIPRMYRMADEQYYLDVIYPLVPTLAKSTKFIDLIDSTFGGSAEVGITDTSRRLNPDDFEDMYLNAKSSLLATASRVMSMLDRTYEIPEYRQNYSISNTTAKATSYGDYFYRGQLTGLSFTAISESGGTFTCDQFTDYDLSYERCVTNTTSVVEHSTNSDSTKDRARFGGTSTSISQLQYVFEITGSIPDSLGQMIYPVALDTNYIGIVNVNLMQGRWGNNFYFYVTSSDNRQVLLSGISFFDITSLNGSSASINQTVSLVRSCTSSWTRRATYQDVTRILPASVPCGSAFDTGRSVQPTASFLCWICRYWHNSTTNGRIGDDVTYLPSLTPSISMVEGYTRMVNRTLSDASSLRSTYLSERGSDFDKVSELMESASVNWNNVDVLSRVDRGFINEDATRGSVRINGGTFTIGVSIDGYSQGSVGSFVAEMEDIGGGWMQIVTLGYFVGGEYHWFDPSTSIDYTISIAQDDEGIGYGLSEDAQDLNAMSIDSCAIPMVTTDWNWKALKMSN